MQGESSARRMLQRIALEQAIKDGCEAHTHKALHVDPAQVKRRVGYRVVKGVLAEVKPGRLTPKSLSTRRRSTSH
jgi:hypothetical protein